MLGFVQLLRKYVQAFYGYPSSWMSPSIFTFQYIYTSSFLLGEYVQAFYGCPSQKLEMAVLHRGFHCKMLGLIQLLRKYVQAFYGYPSSWTSPSIFTFQYIYISSFLWIMDIWVKSLKWRPCTSHCVDQLTWSAVHTAIYFFMISNTCPLLCC